MSNLENKVVTRIMLSVDTSIHNSPGFVYAKQYDVKSRYLKAMLISSAGVIPISGIAQLNATLPHGEKVYILGTINPDYSIDFSLKSSILSTPGNVVCDVSVQGSDNGDPVTLTSSSFSIIVSPSQYSSDAWEGEDGESGGSASIIATMAGYAQEATKAAEDARLVLVDVKEHSERTEEMVSGLDSAVSETLQNAKRAEDAVAQASEHASTAKEHADIAREVADTISDDYQAVIAEVRLLKDRVIDATINPDDLAIIYDSETNSIHNTYLGDQSSRGLKVSELPEIMEINQKLDDLETGGSFGGSVPEVNEADNGKFLMVVDGSWKAVAIPRAEEVSV